jgi:non-ribosomal peptide synthase protein (TIGR01720 family)
MRVARAIAEAKISGEVEIEVVTEGVQVVTGSEEIRAEGGMVAGPVKVIGQEYVNVECRSIDMEWSRRGGREIEKVVEEMRREIREKEVAIRGEKRWVRGYERVKLEERKKQVERAKEEGKDRGRLRERGVYVVTGGTGAIGLEIGRYIAREVKGRIVLVGRSGLGSEGRREEEAGEGEGEGRKKGETETREEDIREKNIREKIREMEEQGAEVEVMRGDVSKEEEIRGVIERVYEKYGEINGLFHCAGTVSGGLIQFKTKETAESVFAPKVRGTQLLDLILKNRKLDFIVLCSSHRSIIGGVGAVDYCSANAFLDAFALSKQYTPGTFVVSINWDAWQQVGMSAKATLQANLTEEALKDAIMPEEGVAALGRILNSSFPQVIVSTRDFNYVIEESETSTASNYLEQLEREPVRVSSHPRPQLATAYVAPRSEAERLIAGIWQQLLGIEPVGIHDNFFELGGDSIISIQVIARAAQAGVRLSARQVFDYQTIAELAAVADTAELVKAEQGSVTGPVMLTPVQHRLLDQKQPDIHHFNQSLLLETEQSLAPASLLKVLDRLLAHHDMLRLRAFESEGRWQQMIAESEDSSMLTCFDLSDLSADHRDLAFRDAVGQTQRVLNISGGPIIRVALFDMGRHMPTRLLFVIHHLAIDAISWRFLLEDLQRAFEQLSSGRPVELPAKTSSFKHWSERLNEYAQSDALLQEVSYWTAERRAHVRALPKDYTDGENTVGSMHVVSVTLEAEETRSLLQDVPATYGTQINDVLMTALLLSFEQWTGAQLLLIDFEGHGREALFEDVDLSRTVGWFTTFYPVLLEGENAVGRGELLKSIKEQLRAIPNHGIGYGLLRYLKKDSAIKESLSRMPQADVSFLYLGQLDQVVQNSSAFQVSKESTGANRSLNGKRDHLLEINGFVVDGRLRMDWMYSEKIHSRATIEALAQGFVAELKSLVAYCLSPNVSGYTPSDFPEAELGQEDLDELIGKLSQA